MMEQGGELQLLVSPCCLPYTRQPLGHVSPALCRAHVELSHVLLVQRPSLPTLRDFSFVFVRMVHQYYAAVRLLCDSRRALRPWPSLAVLPSFRLSRCRGGLPVLVHEVSRRALGSTTTRDCSRTRARALAHAAFHHLYSVGIPIARFRSSIAQPACAPVYASPSTSRQAMQNSGPSGSLLLSRKTLSFSTSCRFIPALRDPEDECATMTIQEVRPRDCPRKRISRPQFSARSCQRGFIFSIKVIFFSRRQRLICFSRPMATCTSWWLS